MRCCCGRRSGAGCCSQFHRPADRLAAIRRRLDDVRDAESSSEWSGAEDGDASMRRRLRAIGYRDTTNMSPTDRRTTAEALRTLAVLNRASRGRSDREKRASAKVERPAEFDIEPVMVARTILPEGPTPQEFAEHAALADRARPAQTSEERLRQQAFATQARHRAQSDRQMDEALRWAAWAGRRPRDEDAPRRIGMPGLGGM